MNMQLQVHEQSNYDPCNVYSSGCPCRPTRQSADILPTQNKSAKEEHIRKYCCPGKIKITSTYAPIIGVRGKFSLFLIGPFLSDFLTNSSSWRLAKSLEETTDHRRGWTPPAPDRREEPPVILQQQRKPRRGDRDISKLLLNKLYILSPLRGLLLLGYHAPGVTTPVCVLSHLWCFSPDSNNI